MTVFYLGCWSEVGHHMHASDGGLTRGRLPFELDDPGRWGTLYAKQHERKLHHVDGWTVLSMADNTVDTRPGSHMTFAMVGTHSTEDAERHARAAFPFIWERVDRATPQESTP